VVDAGDVVILCFISVGQSHSTARAIAPNNEGEDEEEDNEEDDEDEEMEDMASPATVKLEALVSDDYDEEAATAATA
jgi:hypothetical protein